jgi:hypothetical protein
MFSLVSKHLYNVFINVPGVGAVGAGLGVAFTKNVANASPPGQKDPVLASPKKMFTLENTGGYLSGTKMILMMMIFSTMSLLYHLVFKENNIEQVLTYQSGLKHPDMSCRLTHNCWR